MTNTKTREHIVGVPAEQCPACIENKEQIKLVRRGWRALLAGAGFFLKPEAPEPVCEATPEPQEAAAASGEAPRPCPDCEAVGSCCEAAKGRLATADSLGRLVDRQKDVLGDQATQLAEIAATAHEDFEAIRMRHCVTEAGIKTINIGAPGSVAREAQEDVATLVHALWLIHKIAGRKQP